MSSKDTHRGNNEAGALRKRLASFVHTVKNADTTTKVLWGSVALAVVVMAFVVVMVATNPGTSGDVVQEEPRIVIRHPLTGEETDVVGYTPQVFAVMIENSADAWPLAGLEDAFLVIEAPVEGMIPRFAAFFEASGGPDKIGPVRSARPYYLDWADELDAVYAHVGGSPEALELIEQYGTFDLNEFYQGEYFYRSTRRDAPHNAYTTMEDLVRSLDELHLTYDFDTPEYEVWMFKDGEASGEAKSLAIDWTSGTTYDVDWVYDAARNWYMCEQGGTSNFLEGGAEATAHNVVVMESDIEVVDTTGRRHIRTTGEGDALVAQDGRVIVATWKKETRTSRLRFYDANGNEVAMNAGKTWIEVLGDLGQVTIDDTQENTASE